MDSIWTCLDALFNVVLDPLLQGGLHFLLNATFLVTLCVFHFIFYLYDVPSSVRSFLCRFLFPPYFRSLVRLVLYSVFGNNEFYLQLLFSSHPFI